MLDAMLLIKAALMGVVEGLTEFLPISSTGHLILAGALLDMHDERAKVFEIAIQTGAMLAVIWEYRLRLTDVFVGWRREARSRRFILNLVTAFVPAAIAGLLVGKAFKASLFHPVPVAIAFVVGGVIILWVERWHAQRYGQAGDGSGRRARVESVDEMSGLDALKVGLLQCLALIPGTSRSGATIIGAMCLGFSRRCATEFSFFLGIPTLMAAGAYSVIKQWSDLHAADLPMFAVGTLFAFLSAWLCIRWLIRYVATHSFVVFAWYRIAFGAVILLTAWQGWVQWGA